jgi:hypothetical protein
VIAAYQLALKLNNDPKVDEWETDGGCHREYLDACSDLQILLGRLGWEAQVLDTIGADEVPECFLSWPDYAATWPKAVEIRQELERRCLVT